MVTANFCQIRAMGDLKRGSFPFWKLFKVTWNSICIIATIATVIWQLSNYIYGDDMTVVGFKRFNDKEIDVYPSIGFCFTVALNNDILKRYFLSIHFTWFT